MRSQSTEMARWTLRASLEAAEVVGREIDVLAQLVRRIMDKSGSWRDINLKGQISSGYDLMVSVARLSKGKPGNFGDLGPD